MIRQCPAQRGERGRDGPRVEGEGGGPRPYSAPSRASPAPERGDEAGCPAGVCAVVGEPAEEQVLFEAGLDVEEDGEPGERRHRGGAAGCGGGSRGKEAEP